MSTFGTRLRAIREAKSLSQERLGFELGASKATISKWENGKGEPSLAQLTRLREVFADVISGLDELVCGGSRFGTKVRDQAGEYASDPRYAASAAEVAVLAAFRALPAKKRRAVLDLLGDDAPQPSTEN